MSGGTAKRKDQPGCASSTAPLAKKLGIMEGDLVVTIGAPAGWAVSDLPTGVRSVRRRTTLRSGDEDAAVIVAFVPSAARLAQVAPELVGRMDETASLWIAWPRRAGGHESDVTDQRVREILLPTGVVDVKVAALDEDWSALKFVVRRSQRTRTPARPTTPGRLRPGGAGGR
jgi:hypothetical protein